MAAAPTDDRDPGQFQYKRYRELQLENPCLLRTITHGFTKKLGMFDRPVFVRELVRAGRRQCTRADEERATDERGILHVAMSYRHAGRSDGAGTIDHHTAEEAYEAVLGIPLVRKYTVVRIWIDQNLHRYHHPGEWYERGFLPYAVMRVVSVLSRHGGLSLGRRRPWIWVETGLALNSIGIHCKKETMTSATEVLALPSDSLLNSDVIELQGWILGTGYSVFNSVQQALRTVSLWTPDMLEHKEYDREYLEDFKRFCQWAKAQTVRLTRKGKLDLTSDMFENTLIEDVAWMRSLPLSQGNRQLMRSPYLRIEVKSHMCSRLVSLLKASAKCQEFDGIVEMLGKNTGLETFCFEQHEGISCFNINPSKRDNLLRSKDAESYSALQDDINALIEWQGGFATWDRRFNGMPKLTYCGRIFGRHFGMRPKFGLEADVIDVGGFRFESNSFMNHGLCMERIYTSCIDDNEVFIAESDVLCLRELGKDLERETVLGLRGHQGANSVSRILAAEADVRDAIVTPRTMGTRSDEVLSVMEELTERGNIGPGETLIRRARLNEDTLLIGVRDDNWGQGMYSFRTTANHESVLDYDLIGFRTGGSIDDTLTKVRLMMGSDEFSAYSQDGLSLGIGRRSGSAGKYPGKFRLEGSEFRRCLQCDSIYSPVNGRVGIICTCRETKVMSVEWRGLHRCGMIGEDCGIVGDIA